MHPGKQLRTVVVAGVTDLGGTVTRVRFAPLSTAVPPSERHSGGFLRLFFPCNLEGRSPTAHPKVTLCHKPRTFTVRAWLNGGHFEVDFARHQGTGPAANWIAHARPGDTLLMGRVGPPELDIHAMQDPAVLVADPGGIPLVAALVEALPNAVDVTLCLSIEPGASPLSLPRDHGQQLLVTNRSRAPGEHALADLVRRAPIAPRAQVFVACEASEMRAIRRFLLNEAGHDPARLIAKSCWTAQYAKAKDGRQPERGAGRRRAVLVPSWATGEQA